jgi:hypothetical protein
VSVRISLRVPRLISNPHKWSNYFHVDNLGPIMAIRKMSRSSLFLVTRSDSDQFLKIYIYINLICLFIALSFLSYQNDIKELIVFKYSQIYLILIFFLSTKVLFEYKLNLKIFYFNIFISNTASLLDYVLFTRSC